MNTAQVHGGQTVRPRRTPIQHFQAQAGDPPLCLSTSLGRVLVTTSLEQFVGAPRPCHRCSAKLARGQGLPTSPGQDPEPATGQAWQVFDPQGLILFDEDEAPVVVVLRAKTALGWSAIRTDTGARILIEAHRLAAWVGGEDAQ